jgi:glycosyltransferase involved in cell wall biosynthesis
VPIKGQEVLLQALALPGAFPGGAEVLIVGDGEADYVRGLKAMAPPTPGVRAEWPGFVQDVAPLLRTCAVLACPSHREPLGRVILEAWDAGAVPVVYGGAGGAAEVVAAADGGIVYADQTPQSLARALETALSLDGAEAARLIANGRAWMAAHCAPEPYGHAVAAVLKQAARR